MCDCRTVWTAASASCVDRILNTLSLNSTDWTVTRGWPGCVFQMFLAHQFDRKSRIGEYFASTKLSAHDMNGWLRCVATVATHLAVASGDKLVWESVCIGIPDSRLVTGGGQARQRDVFKFKEQEEQSETLDRRFNLHHLILPLLRPLPHICHFSSFLSYHLSLVLDICLFSSSLLEERRIPPYAPPPSPTPGLHTLFFFPYCSYFPSAPLSISSIALLSVFYSLIQFLLFSVSSLPFLLH